MEENKELQAHLYAIREWASKSDNRVAFVVCGELNGKRSDTTNILYGRRINIARALYGNAMENECFKGVLNLTSRMIEEPLLAQILTMEIADEISGKESKESDKDDNGLKDALEDLLDAIKKKFSDD